MDVVTFYRRTADQIGTLRADSSRWQRLQILAKSPKADFLCDAYLVNMVNPGAALVAQSHYWYGLFSHQRGSLAWKGMLQVNVASADDDEEAGNLLSMVVVP